MEEAEKKAGEYVVFAGRWLVVNKKPETNKFEAALETLLFASRWLLAPFFIGLVVVMVALLLRFSVDLWNLLGNISLGPGISATEKVVVHSISLVDTALIASLLLITAFSGYRNFVSAITVNGNEDSYVWEIKTKFSDLKIQLIGVMVAISGLELLKESSDLVNLFTGADIAHSTVDRLIWRVIIHLTFVVSGLLFAVTDRVVAKKAE
jgi:uncharacterized protein (TIGR00645 family)